MNLDNFGVFNKNSEMEKPMILSDAHALYLWEQSHDRMVEKNYDYLIQEYLAEEQMRIEEENEKHARYVKNNYIRVGGN